jgi:ADP-ribosylglycohydrolase
MPEDLVVSTGYVLHTLHASLWCLLKSASFSECVLQGVNLGGDTDTVGCVAGGLAGIAYGLNAIPAAWREALPRGAELDSLFERFCEKVG